MLNASPLVSTRSAGVYYAETCGWRIVRCGEKSKQPIDKGWTENAPNDPEKVKALLARHRGNIGVVTGAKSGLLVLDVDLPDGEATLSRLEEELGKLPETLVQRTGSGARQLFFKYPAGRVIKNSVSDKGKGLGKNLDIRAEGGQVIVPPSVHPSGKFYAWATKGVLPAELPPAWIERIESTGQPHKQATAQATPRPATGELPPYVKAAVEAELNTLATCAAGARNDTANRTAFAVGQWVGGGYMTEGEAYARVFQAAVSCGLVADDGEAAIAKTINSGLRAGMGEPRQAPEKAIEARAKQEETLPPGFSLRTGGSLPGLWHTEVKENSDPVETWIGPALHVLGMTRDDSNTSWGLLLEWCDLDGNLHTWAMPKALLVGKDNSAWLGRLADEGWSGAPGSHAKKLLALYLTTYRTAHRARCVDRTGWHNSVFVFPDKVIENVSDVSDVVGRSYSGNGFEPSDNESSCRTCRTDLLPQAFWNTERVVLQLQTAHNPFRTGGTLDGWRDSIGEWSRGNSRLMMAVCASLAAPLLYPSGQESGGFNWVGQSSTGKTTALVAAGSVWGKGTSSGGYVQNWRATSNGLEGLAALHSDAALCLDEIGQAPGRTIMEASYMLANGMGKTRSGRDGSAKAAKSWRCMVLSTGEKGLAEKIAEEGGRVQAGQLVRLIDIPADAGAGMGIFEKLHGHDSPQAFSEAIKQAAAIHYGLAARAFIGKIQEEGEALRGKLNTALASAGKLFCSSGASGQVERIARRFALCTAAGEMAAEWGLLPWGEGEALLAAKSCFDSTIALRGGDGAAEDTAILEQVMFFIEQHGVSRFQDVDNPAAVCINRVGFRRNTGAGTEYMILPESFKADVCKGLNAKRAAAVLLEKGILIPGEGRNYMRYSPVELPSYGRRKRCYTILVNGGDNDGMA